ncbi:MAG: sugar transporter [Acidobacteria bacterium]|nr:sugar transporter [Acidobacteriota bacterium]
MKTMYGSFLMLMALATAAFAQDMPLTPDGPIGPRDRIEIRVVQDPSLNVTATVGDDGRIALPLLGKVEVAGLTPSQVEAQLKGLLEAKYVTRADVSVQVVEYGNRPISVVGAVTHPGRINATANITLIQALTQAGGLASGYGKALYVLRTGRNGLTEQISVDIEDLMVNGNPDLNLPLAPNDVVNVPMDTPIVVYVLGEVMRPGPVQFRRSQTPTLLQALASAGGPTDRASRTVNIKRLVNGKDTRISVNFRRIANGDNADVALQDNDTVVVRESVF